MFMQSQPRRAYRVGLTLLSIAIASAAATGCARWDWRGKGFGDDSNRWAQKMRPPADEKKLTGLDARAQEIERNLGVR